MANTVLIVDDSLTVRMDLHEAFEEGGFRTVLCATSAEAIAAFDAEQFEIAVLDVRLPDGDGVELLQRLRTHPRHAGAVVLLLSAEAEVRDRLRAPAPTNTSASPTTPSSSWPAAVSCCGRARPGSTGARSWSSTTASPSARSCAAP